MKMFKTLMLGMVMFFAAVLHAQTPTFVSIPVARGVTVNAGECVALAPSTGTATNCDNTATPPPLVVGVACPTYTSGVCSGSVTGAHTVPPTATLVQVAVAGKLTVPNLAYPNAVSFSQFVGDTDGTGNINSMGNEISVSSQGPLSYVGLGLGTSANLLQISLVVQPGYIPAP